MDKFTEDNFHVVATYEKENGTLIFLEPNKDYQECLKKCLGKGVEY